MLLLLASQGLWAMQDPLSLVRDTSDQVLAKVTAKKQELNESPGKIYDLVEHDVVPHFDFVRMSRLVLGRYWRQASQVQQSDFVEQFRILLVRTYATALLNYSGQPINYLPLRMVEGVDEVTVNTEVAEPGAVAIPIDYSLYLNGDHWKVYDVTIDSVSLVSNYRTSFNTQIRRYGIDGLIDKLKQRNEGRE